MMNILLNKLILAGLFLLATLVPATSASELTVASPFTDNAVLQRGIQVPVWGTADGGSNVTVEFDGQKKTSVADDDGKWMVQLDPLSENARPQSLLISDTKTTIDCANVLVGEVWICSGQSNMAFFAKNSPEVNALVPLAKNIRCFEVKNVVAMTPQDRLEGEWVEGPPSSAVAFSFAYYLEKAGDIPVGIILTSWGSSSIEGWMPRDMIDTVPHFKTMIQEFDADTKTRDRITSILEGARPWVRKEDVFLRRQSNIIYNAMMHPLIPYACRGLVWYQGERNTHSMMGMLKKPWYSRNSGMLKYGDTLKAWVQRYRKAWNNQQMHFMVVMLPGYHSPLKTGPEGDRDDPTTHSWSWMRESQLKVLELSHTSVANTIDLGNAKNVHPKDKLPIGQRLALLAARDTLGQDIEARGPMMKRVDVLDSQLIVHFDHAKGLKTIDENTPSGFWLADDSANWVKAVAKIEGESVVLSSSELEKPLYVRYAFSGKPTVNLVNDSGLPVYPFRTDTFKP